MTGDIEPVDRVFSKHLHGVSRGVAVVVCRASLAGFRTAGSGRIRLDAPAENFREDFPGGFAFLRRQLLGGEKDVIIDIEGRSYTRDDIASDAESQFDLSRVESSIDFLQHERRDFLRGVGDGEGF